MDILRQENLLNKNKSDFEAFMQQNNTRLYSNQQQIKTQELTDLSQRKKMLQFIQNIEPNQRDLDKMMKIQKNQKRMLNALAILLVKNKKKSQKHRDDKPILCTACLKQKYFANKYALKRHIAAKHNNTNNQKNIESNDQGLFS